MYEQVIKITLRMLEQGPERKIALATIQLSNTDISNCYQKERLITITERLRQEGHQIDRQRGKLEGIHEQAIKVALRTLKQGIDRNQVLVITQLSEVDLTTNSH